MPSKGVLDRQRIGRAIIHAARTHAQQVGQRLQENLQGLVAEGETVSDFITPQLELARYLEMRLEALVAADETHLEELDDDQEPRILRDEAAAALYSTLVRIRAAVNAAFGTVRGTKFLGVDGETSRDPLKLHRQASRALVRLRRPSEELPPLEIGGIALDLEGLADELQPAAPAFWISAMKARSRPPGRRGRGLAGVRVLGRQKKAVHLEQIDSGRAL